MWVRFVGKLCKVQAIVGSRQKIWWEGYTCMCLVRVRTCLYLLSLYTYVMYMQSMVYYVYTTIITKITVVTVSKSK